LSNLQLGEIAERAGCVEFLIFNHSVTVTKLRVAVAEYAMKRGIGLAPLVNADRETY